MKHEPLVSIITPCYNGENYLKAFLDSVLLQEYQNFELIFVNDGSTDGTESIALEYGSKLEERGARFHYIYQENAGQAAAINQGLRIFSGEYLMWIDSDDILLPNHISEKVAFLEGHPEFGFVLAQGENVNASDLNHRKSILERKKPEGKDHLFEDLIYEKNVVFGPGTIMARREAIEAAIPTKKIYPSREGQNWQLMLPLAYMYQCGYLEKVLFKCVAHADSHSRMHRNYEQWIARCNGFQELLTQTIESIPGMGDVERLEWRKQIAIKCAKKRLECTYRFLKFGEMKAKRDELLKLGYRIKIHETFVPYLFRGVCRKLKRKLLG